MVNKMNTDAKEYSIIISDNAKYSFVNHILFIKEFDMVLAKKVSTSIYSAIETLKYFPYRHPFFNEKYVTNNKYHKMFVEKYYLIIYQIKDDTVYVEMILDCRSDYTWLIPKI